jgi:hypothetical protein
MPPVFLDVLSMIALRPGQPEARSSGSVPSVPQCQAKAEALLDVTEGNVRSAAAAISLVASENSGRR